MSPMLRRFCRPGGWLLLAFIIWATVSPIDLRPDSHLDLGLERAAAFGTVGLLFGLGYHRTWLLANLALVGSVAGIELLQLLTPDRHADFGDIVIKTLGVTAGFLVSRLL